MVGMCFQWERNWLLPQFDMQLWEDLAKAFNIDYLCMIPDLNINATVPLEVYDDWKQFFDAKRPVTKLVFLCPPEDWPDAIPLTEYKHPSECVYVFGTSFSNLPDYITSEDDVVTVETPASHQIWQWHTAAIVLYDRSIKSA